MMKNSFLGIIVIVAAFFAPITNALPTLFNEGEHYTVLDRTVSEKPALLEFFSYHCIHCFHAESMMTPFLAKKPDNLQFERVHVEFGWDAWRTARTLYAINLQLDKDGSKQLHEHAFKYIHEQKKPLHNQQDIKRFLQQQGFEAAKIDQALKGFATRGLTQKMQQTERDVKPRSTPYFLINNKYVINNRAIRGPAQFESIVYFLIQKDFPGIIPGKATASVSTTHTH